MIPKLRIARPSDDLDALLPFYVDGLGFEVLTRFEDHNGFDGIMLGHAQAPWHLEFTRAHGHHAGRAPTQDNLLVLYLPDADDFARAIKRMTGAGFAPAPPSTPTGTALAKPTRIQTVTAWCCKTATGRSSPTPPNALSLGATAQGTAGGAPLAQPNSVRVADPAHAPQRTAHDLRRCRL
ncbi:Glyoxalase/Bleomycin resistance protein/Dioxygenase superfamily protein [Tropicibacter naphthalenivorans]|uniref:Uncharacterized protein n=1 Tax=Tropicibacter naphthalenivorans TaxID=441103 RepID=A0A0P1G108_9RHOB|nr:VOC family protein [Tropicibacter naphthalenivorans]CUH75260.1 hypothetical protein TRN7648_00348 [Tropicibacter naphthalenivorans]SMC45358.1 Glyoxalase/Bleomycin resistance protein/Dioxygenase superfamily protein [Tropicibacter naphthalenivorans]